MPAIIISVALCAAADAQVNLDFETRTADDVTPQGWRSRDSDAEFSLDDRVVHAGTHSLRVTSADASRLNRFSQTLEAHEIHGNRVRITAHVKTSAETTGTAALWVRLDGDTGVVYVDSTRARYEEGTPEWTRREIEVPIPTGAVRVTFGGELAGTGTAWFDDFGIAAVDARTLPAPSPEAARYVERALAIIDEHAVFRGDLDWPTFRDAVMTQTRGAKTATDAYLAIRFALATLGDRHSYFKTPQQVTAQDSAPVGNARTGRAPVAPHGAKIAESIGYVRLPGFAGGMHTDQVAFAESVQQIIRELDSTSPCGWIVDLRGNLGGNLWPMLAGLGPLLGDGEVSASLAPNGARRSVWYENGKAGLDDFVQLRVRGEPYRLHRPDPPVAVLLNSSTASAGEVLAIAFVARPETRSFGASTRGATTVTRIFPLSDGAELVLAVAHATDKHGRVYAGPLTPDEVVPDGERTLALEHQLVVRAAVSWLGAHEACALAPRE
jgi:hypothetical protein